MQEYVSTDWEVGDDGFWSLLVYAPTSVGTRVFRPADPRGDAANHLIVHEVTWVDAFERQDGPYTLVNPAYFLAAGGGPASFDPTVAADAGIPGQLQPGNPPFLVAPQSAVSMVLRVIDKGPYDPATGLLEHAAGYEPFVAEDVAVRGALVSTGTIWGGLVSTKAHFH